MDWDIKAQLARHSGPPYPLMGAQEFCFGDKV